MKDTPIQSIYRAVEILRMSASSEEGVTVSEIAEMLGVSRPPAHNLASSLHMEGFLKKLEKPVRYRLGSAPGQLALEAQDTLRRSASRNSVVKLTRRFPGTGWVYAEAEQDDMRIIWRIDFKRPDVVERVDREVSHPYDTATALVFHAFADEPRAEAMRRRFPFAEFGRGIWERRKDFDQFLRSVRDSGAVTAPWSVDRELGAVAAPVFDRGNRLTGSVGAFYPLSSAVSDTSELMDALRDTAKRLSEPERSTGEHT